MPYDIRIRKDAIELEQHAARELQHYVRRLFGVEAAIRIVPDQRPPSDGDRFALWLAPEAASYGAELQNQTEAAGLNEQHYRLNGTDGGGLRLSGGSAAALLWAVYELAEQWGVVYTLQGDIYPECPLADIVPELNRTYKPRQKLRSWRLMSDLYFGSPSWSLDRQRELIGQLAKLRYNGVYLSLWPHQPFLDYEADGVVKTTAVFNFGNEVPIDEHNIGRELLPAGEQFVSPAFAGCRTSRDRHEAGAAYLNAVIARARFFGMHVCISIQPFDFPREFAVLLERPMPVRQLGDLCVAEGGNPLHEAHLRLLRAQFSAVIDTYSGVDEIEIGLPEHGRHSESLEALWDELDSKHRLSSRHDVQAALYDQETGQLAPGGQERVVSEGKMTLGLLGLLHKTLDESGIAGLLRARGIRLSLRAGLSCPALLPVVADALWEGATLRIMTGYASSLAVRNLRVLKRLRGGAARIEQIITLQDDNIGAFPQLCASSVARLLEYGCEQAWDGYVTRFWMTGELDPLAVQLSRLSWEDDTIRASSYGRFALSVYGESAGLPAVLAFRLVEDATLLLDMQLAGLFPVPQVVAGKVGGGDDALLPVYSHALNLYEEARSLFIRAGDSAPGREGREHLRYWRSRMAFAVGVLRGFAQLCTGNRHYQSGDHDRAASAYRQMLEQFRLAVRSIAACARDDSDKAALAVYYHLLIREVEEKLASLGIDPQATGGRNIS